MPFYPGSKQKPSLYERVDQGKVEDPLLGEGGPGVARDGCGAGQGRTWYRPSSAAAAAPSPRGRLRALSCLERVARQSRDGCGGDPWRFKPGPILCVGWLPSSVRAFGPATFPVGEGFLRRGLPAGPPSPGGRLRTLSWERVDRAQPGTGVGRDKVGPGAAPLPPPAGGTFPQGKVKSPLLLGEGGTAKP